MTEPKLGVIFPNKDIGNSRNDLIDFAPSTEKTGLDFVVTYDHIVGIRPDVVDDGLSSCKFNADTNIHEVIVILSAMAALTNRIKLVSGCLVSPQRNTLLTAKQAAEVDIVSGGRLELGVSIGWNEPEFAALGADYKTRAKRLGGQINLMRRLWTEPDVVDEENNLHHVSIKPRPENQIPIWVGGLATPAIERAVVFGDGWMPLGSYNEDMHRRVEHYHEFVPDTPTGRPKQIMGRVNPWKDTFDLALQELRDWTEAGATHVAIGSSENVYESNDQFFSDLNEFVMYARKNLTPIDLYRQGASSLSSPVLSRS
jgi:probable F420-dependent oxidoreductase